MKKNELDGANSKDGRHKKCRHQFGLKYKERDHLKKLGLVRKTMLEWILEKQRGKMWTGCICLRIGHSGEIS
jgi:hypothetical protein